MVWLARWFDEAGVGVPVDNSSPEGVFSPVLACLQAHLSTRLSRLTGMKIGSCHCHHSVPSLDLLALVVKSQILRLPYKTLCCLPQTSLQSCLSSSNMHISGRQLLRVLITMLVPVSMPFNTWCLPFRSYPFSCLSGQPLHIP